MTTLEIPATGYSICYELGIFKQKIIDGKRLAELMIEYNLGVSVESVVEIKRIDTDYFEEQ